jgi:hypothetical protein
MKRLFVLCMLAAPAAEAGTCPPRATLDAIAQDAWEGPAVRPTCSAIRGGEPLTFIVDIATFDRTRPPRGFDPALSGGSGYAAIVDRHGKVRWQQAWSLQVPGDWYDWRVVDLDGDGHDELIANHVHQGHISRSSTISVYTIEHGEPTERTGLRLADHVSPKATEQNSCSGTYRLVRDGRLTLIETVGKHGNDPELSPVHDESCAKEGKHLYRWTGEDFVEKP